MGTIKSMSFEAAAFVMRPGTEWLDARSGNRYIVSRVTPTNLAYGSAPGQGFICGGSHTPSTWVDRVMDGTYEIQNSTPP
jgi:hypothetical protein